MAHEEQHVLDQVSYLEGTQLKLHVETALFYMTNTHTALNPVLSMTV